MDTGDCYPGVKRQQREADHSSPPGTEVKNNGAIPSLSHTSSWYGASLIKHKEKFTVGVCPSTPLCFRQQWKGNVALFLISRHVLKFAVQNFSIST
jgi:hypothetical protein